MVLFEGKSHQSYIIQNIFVEQKIQRRLEALGLNDGTKIDVLNRKAKGAMIIKVRGTRLALGVKIMKAIEVSEYHDEK